MSPPLVANRRPRLLGKWLPRRQILARESRLGPRRRGQQRGQQGADGGASSAFAHGRVPRGAAEPGDRLVGRPLLPPRRYGARRRPGPPFALRSGARGWSDTGGCRRPRGLAARPARPPGACGHTSATPSPPLAHARSSWPARYRSTRLACKPGPSGHTATVQADRAAKSRAWSARNGSKPCPVGSFTRCTRGGTVPASFGARPARTIGNLWTKYRVVGGRRVASLTRRGHRARPMRDANSATTSGRVIAGSRSAVLAILLSQPGQAARRFPAAATRPETGHPARPTPSA